MIMTLAVPKCGPKSRNIILGTDHTTVTLIIFYWWCLLLKFQNIGFPPCHHTTNPPCHYFTLPPCHHTPCYYIIPYQCHISNSNVPTGCLLFCWSARLNKKGTLESGQQAAHYRYRCKLFWPFSASAACSPCLHWLLAASLSSASQQLVVKSHL